MKKYIKKHKKEFIIATISVASLAVVIGAFLINPYAPIMGFLGGLLYMVSHIKIKG